MASFQSLLKCIFAKNFIRMRRVLLQPFHYLFILTIDMLIVNRWISYRNGLKETARLPNFRQLGGPNIGATITLTIIRSNLFNKFGRGKCTSIMKNYIFIWQYFFPYCGTFQTFPEQISESSEICHFVYHRISTNLIDVKPLMLIITVNSIHWIEKKPIDSNLNNTSLTLTIHITGSIIWSTAFTNAELSTTY